MTFDLSVLSGYWPSLARGFGSTAWLCVAGGAMAGALGILLTVGQRRGGSLLVSGGQKAQLDGGGYVQC